MPSAKERMTEVIQAQADDEMDEEIRRELAFERMIERGLDDSRQGKVISTEEMERRIRS
jgi:predicted transcriptional regulator